MTRISHKKKDPKRTAYTAPEVYAVPADRPLAADTRADSAADSATPAHTPAFDRAMGDRIVRALESQSEAQRQQVQELRALREAVRDAGRR